MSNQKDCEKQTKCPIYVVVLNKRGSRSDAIENYIANCGARNVYVRYVACEKTQELKLVSGGVVKLPVVVDAMGDRRPIEAIEVECPRNLRYVNSPNGLVLTKHHIHCTKIPASQTMNRSVIGKLVTYLMVRGIYPTNWVHTVYEPCENIVYGAFTWYHGYVMGIDEKSSFKRLKFLRFPREFVIMTAVNYNLDLAFLGKVPGVSQDDVIDCRAEMVAYSSAMTSANEYLRGFWETVYRFESIMRSTTIPLLDLRDMCSLLEVDDAAKYLGVVAVRNSTLVPGLVVFSGSVSSKKNRELLRRFAALRGIVDVELDLKTGRFYGKGDRLKRLCTQ